MSKYLVNLKNDIHMVKNEQWTHDSKSVVRLVSDYLKR